MVKLFTRGKQAATKQAQRHAPWLRLSRPTVVEELKTFNAIAIYWSFPDVLPAISRRGSQSANRKAYPHMIAAFLPNRAFPAGPYTLAVKPCPRNG